MGRIGHIVAIAWFVAAAAAANAENLKRKVYHIGQQHIIVSSVTGLPADLEISTIVLGHVIGDPDPNGNPPPPPTPSSLFERVQNMLSLVADYEGRESDRRIYGSVFTAVAVQRPSPSQVRELFDQLQQQAAPRLTVDFNTRWYDFRNSLNAELRQQDLKTTDKIAEVYGTIGEALLTDPAAAIDINFRTLLRIIVIVIEGVSEQRPFLDILLDILEVLGI